MVGPLAGHLGANFGNGISQRATLHRQAPHPHQHLLSLPGCRERLNEGLQMGIYFYIVSCYSGSFNEQSACYQYSYTNGNISHILSSCADN